MEKKWVIINLVEEDEGIKRGVWHGVLDKKWGPTHIYYGREEAEKALLSLQKKYHWGEFVLFESVSEVRVGFKNVLFVEPIIKHQEFMRHGIPVE